MTNFEFRKFNLNSSRLNQLGRDCKKLVEQNKEHIPTATTAAIIAPAGMYQTRNDYKNAQKKEKFNVLFNNFLMIGGTIGGGYGCYKLLPKLIPSKANSLGNEWLHTMAVPIGAVLGGIASGLTAEKIFPVKSLKRDLNLEAKLNLLSTFDYEDISKASNNKPVVWGAVLDNGLGTLAGYQVARESGFDNKINKGAHTVISTAVAGAITFLAAHVIKDHKTTNKMSKNIAIPLILTISGVSCVIGNSIANWINNKLTNRLLKVKILKQVEQNRKALLKYTLKNFHSLTSSEKGKVLKGLSELKKTSKYLEGMNNKKKKTSKSTVAEPKKAQPKEISKEPN